MSSTGVAAAAVAAQGIGARRWAWVLAGAARGLAAAFLPTPAGLIVTGQRVLATLVFMVVLWVSQAIPTGLTAILLMGLLVPAGVKPVSALSGFSGSSLWLVLCVLFYGFAMQRTGLAQRVAYYLLSLFPLTYPGILSAFFLIGVVLSAGIPSMTVRTAILVPIAWALVKSLGLAPRSKGCALIMITSVEMAVIPGCASLYGSLYGPVVLSVFQSRHLPITWGSYAAVFLPPTLLLCGLVIVGNLLLMHPAESLHAPPGLVRSKLRALGSVSRAEWLTGAVVVISMLLWATDSLHHQPAFVVGVLGVLTLYVTGVIGDSDIQGGISWNLVLFLGGVFGLANVIQEQRIPEWLAGYLVPMAHSVSSNTTALLCVVAVGILVVKFLDPSGFVAIPVVFLPVVDIAWASGVKPLVTMAAIVLAATPFFLSYENIWVTMCEGMTRDEAFTGGQRTRLAFVYAVAAVAVIAVSVLYWAKVA
jgi:anion transporter